MHCPASLCPSCLVVRPVARPGGGTFLTLHFVCPRFMAGLRYAQAALPFRTKHMLYLQQFKSCENNENCRIARVRRMTFSIVAVDRKTGTLGVATASGRTHVGNRVPHAKEGAGAIATQGLTEVSYGTRGLELLGRGNTANEALGTLLETDANRELRQVIIIDALGRKAAFTGKENFDHKGHVIGEGYIVAGNLLASENVLEKMAAAFARRGKFAGKLLSALEAGWKAGGDKRGTQSAALVVRSASGGENLALKVDNNRDAVRELLRLFREQR